MAIKVEPTEIVDEYDYGYAPPMENEFYDNFVNTNSSADLNDYSVDNPSGSDTPVSDPMNDPLYNDGVCILVICLYQTN